MPGRPRRWPRSRRTVWKGRPSRAVGFDHRPADRVGRGVGLGDRAVEEADAVVPFEIGRVGQDEVGIGRHLGGVGVGVDDARDAVGAGFVAVREHLHDGGGVHRRVPRHVGHVEEERVDGVRVARMGVRDHHVEEPMDRQRVLPAEGLVDAGGGAVLAEREVVGAEGEAEVRAVERLAGTGAEMGARVGARGLGVGRLEAEGAGRVHRADQAWRRWSARAVWKPFEWAEMPRMAWMATGRAVKPAWVSPRKSVQGCGTVKDRSKAAWAISAASAWMRAGERPVRAATVSGA
jgi:hypothetical protein